MRGWDDTCHEGQLRPVGPDVHVVRAWRQVDEHRGLVRELVRAAGGYLERDELEPRAVGHGVEGITGRGQAHAGRGQDGHEPRAREQDRLAGHGPRRARQELSEAEG